MAGSTTGVADSAIPCSIPGTPAKKPVWVNEKGDKVAEGTEGAVQIPAHMLGGG